MTLWSWLLSGSDVQTLSTHWLQHKMPAHDDWTRRQQQPGMALITADTTATAQRQFWTRLAEKKQPRFGANVAQWKTR